MIPNNKNLVLIFTFVFSAAILALTIHYFNPRVKWRKQPPSEWADFGRTSPDGTPPGDGTSVSGDASGARPTSGRPAPSSNPLLPDGEAEANLSHPPAIGEPAGLSNMLMNPFEPMPGDPNIFGATSTNAESTPTPRPFVQPIISGRVTDSRGAPAPFAPVKFFIRDAAPPVSDVVFADAEGFYTISLRGQGMTEMYADPPADSFLAASEVRKKLIMSGAEFKDENFTLPDGESIEGLVLNEEKKPVEWANVEANLAAGRRISSQDTNAEGRFIIRGIPQNQAVATLTVSHPQYQPQTRPDVNMLEGLQTFILKRANNVILSVTWKLDGTPVEYYAYKVFCKSSINELYVDAEKQVPHLETKNGQTAIADLSSGSWHVEVTVTDPDGNPTDLRSSADFRLDAGQQGLVISVAMDGGRRISGSVVMEKAGGELASGALIEFIPPSAGFGRFPTLDAPFKFPSAVTGEDGAFSFEGMPPGRYTIQARKDTIRTPQAVDIDVPYNADPAPVEIVLIQGGVIYGTISGKDAAPLSGAYIAISEQRLNADGWLEKNFQSDADGKYRFEGLPAGAHYIWVSGDGVFESRMVDLEAGQEREVNFDLSGNVNLSGVILLNGAPAPPGFGCSFFGEDSGAIGGCSIQEGGRYEAVLKPGRVFMRLTGANAPKGEVEPFVLEATPSYQTRDFDLRVEEADIILNFPEGESFAPGQLVICPRERATRYGFLRVKMDQSVRHVLSLLAGEYQATFSSRDGVWQGETDWVSIGSGASAFVLDVKKILRGVRVGGWSPGQLSSVSFTPITIDVTPLVSSGGKMEILVRFESGRHAVETGAVSLIFNGAPVSTDNHKGWSGSDHWNNVYHLELNAPPAGAPCLLRVEIRCDGGSDSAGGIFLSMN